MSTIFLSHSSNFFNPYSYGTKPNCIRIRNHLATAIRDRKITSVQVVSAYINQIEEQNATYNAVALLNKENAIERAKEADSALEKGEL